MSNSAAARRVAVIGSGISGLTAAYALRTTAEVTLFEADDRFGGHAHTHTVEDADDTHRIDSGFIVHNDRTYPLLRRLFAELEVDVRPTEMSMSIHCDGCGLEYAGGRGTDGIFAQRRRLADPRHLALLLAVRRFQRLAREFLHEGGDEPRTYGDFLRIHRFSEHFITHYAIPVVSCVWSSGREAALSYPARYLFTFLEHHGFLSLRDAPQWFTVAGGSRTYVDKVTAAIAKEDASCVRRSTPIRAITRKPDAVELIDAGGVLHIADAVVIATHADDALALLTDPSEAERRVLGAFEYSRNETLLHRDGRILPQAASARSSWNYRMDDCGRRDEGTTVTYWMNRLQGIESVEPFLVTLNSSERIDPSTVIARMDYTHPVYTPASLAAQAELPRLNTDRTVFAGAYHGWGFHEDGCRSGVEAAAALSSTTPGSATPVSEALAATW